MYCSNNNVDAVMFSVNKKSLEKSWTHMAVLLPVGSSKVSPSQDLSTCKYMAHLQLECVFKALVSFLNLRCLDHLLLDMLHGWWLCLKRPRLPTPHTHDYYKSLERALVVAAEMTQFVFERFVPEDRLQNSKVAGWCCYRVWTRHHASVHTRLGNRLMSLTDISSGL